MSLGEGFGVGFRWVVGAGFFVESEGKGEEGGGGVGTSKRTGKSMRTCLSKPCFSELPCSFSRVIAG